MSKEKDSVAHNLARQAESVEVSSDSIFNPLEGRDVTREDLLERLKSSQSPSRPRPPVSGLGIELSELMKDMPDFLTEELERRYSQIAQELSRVNPEVLRDAHAISLARDYLRAKYPEALAYLSGNPAGWFPPRDGDSQNVEELASLRWNNSPAEDLSLVAVDMWKEIYGPNAPTASEVFTGDVQLAVDLLISEWESFLGVDFTRHGTATTVSRPAPVITTDKFIHNLKQLNSTTVTPGKNKALRGGEIDVLITMGSLDPVPVSLTATHILVSDSIGALYRRHEEESGSQHAHFSVSQIVQQIMRTNNPSEEQKKEVENLIDELRQYYAAVTGSDYEGNSLRYEGNVVMAYKTVVRTSRGNSVTGYKITDAPVLFQVSERHNSARQVEAILEPRKGGWKPPGISGMSVYTFIARQLFMFHGSRFNSEKAKYVYYKTVQENLGGEYAPETITPWRERTVRKYVGQSIQELQARGMITRFQDNYSGRKKIGFKIWLPKKFPDLRMSPEETRKLERR